MEFSFNRVLGSPCNFTKVQFYFHCTNFSNYDDFLNIQKNLYIWYCWKAVVEWNNEIENIFENRKTKVEK